MATRHAVQRCAFTPAALTNKLVRERCPQALVELRVEEVRALLDKGVFIELRTGCCDLHCLYKASSVQDWIAGFWWPAGCFDLATPVPAD